jgi:hypothetical protein
MDKYWNATIGDVSGNMDTENGGGEPLSLGFFLSGKWKFEKTGIFLILTANL